jgi:hypothetical protein
MKMERSWFARVQEWVRAAVTGSPQHTVADHVANAYYAGVPHAAAAALEAYTLADHGPGAVGALLALAADTDDVALLDLVLSHARPEEVWRVDPASVRARSRAFAVRCLAAKRFRCYAFVFAQRLRLAKVLCEYARNACTPPVPMPVPQLLTAMRRAAARGDVPTLRYFHAAWFPFHMDTAPPRNPETLVVGVLRAAFASLNPAVLVYVRDAMGIHLGWVRRCFPDFATFAVHSLRGAACPADLACWWLGCARRVFLLSDRDYSPAVIRELLAEPGWGPAVVLAGLRAGVFSERSVAEALADAAAARRLVALVRAS